MPRFEIRPDLDVPDDDAARLTLALWEGLRDGTDVSDFFTEDYLLEGSPLRIAMLSQGPSGNVEAIENADEHYPDASVRLQEIITSPRGVMCVLAVSPGGGEHGLVVYTVSELHDGKVTRSLAFSELLEAREALAD